MARSFEEVADGWSLLILREAFKGTTCFADFEQSLGIPPTTLTRRLAALCANGIMVRREYQARPPREGYELTEKGTELLPVLLAFGEWGNRWLAPEGALIVPVDPESGKPMEPTLVDRRTGKPICPGRVALAAGPGASKTLRADLANPILLAVAK